MRLLLDTHILLWAAGYPGELSKKAVRLLEDTENELYFSAASLWEVAIKSISKKFDFDLDPRILRQGLLDNGYRELTISSLHAVSIDSLPKLHKDPFDHILLAQAISEGINLVTADSLLARYPGPITKV